MEDERRFEVAWLVQGLILGCLQMQHSLVLIEPGEER